MTQRTFMKKFRAIAGKFYWHVNHRGRLRGFLKGSNKAVEYCPLTALARIETGKIYQTFQISNAGFDIRFDDYGNVTTAADYFFKDSVNPQLRRSLLKATRPKGAEIPV